MMSEGHEGNCSNDTVETTAQAALQFAHQMGAMGGETGIFKTDWWGDISTSPSPANL